MERSTIFSGKAHYKSPFSSSQTLSLPEGIVQSQLWKIVITIGITLVGDYLSGYSHHGI